MYVLTPRKMKQRQMGYVSSKAEAAKVAGKYKKRTGKSLYMYVVTKPVKYRR